MATVTIPQGIAAFSWGASGDLGGIWHIPANTAAFQWNTSGGVNLIKVVEPATAAWTFDTLSANDLVKKELLVGGGITVQVWDRDNLGDIDNGLLALLQYKTLKFEDELNGYGSYSIDLGPEYRDALWLERDNVVKFIVEGVERFSGTIDEILDIPIAEDETSTLRLVGRGICSILELGAVAPQGWGSDTPSVKRTWSIVTRGEVLNQLFNEVKSRGTWGQVQQDGWNGTVDSKGNVWNNLADMEFNAGGSYGALLNSWTEYGFEYHMNSNYSLALAPELGRDLSALVHLIPLNTVKGLENTTTRRDIRTMMFVEDGNGGVSLIQDLGAVTKWGQREQYTVFSDAIGEGTRTANGYALLELIKEEVTERRVKIDPFTPGRRPFVDFDVGDKVTVRFGSAQFAFRVLAIALSIDEDNKLTAEVTLDFMLEAQRKRRQRLLNGSGGGGGVSTTQQSIFVESELPINIGTTPVNALGLAVGSFASTYAKVGWLINGTASGPLQLKMELMQAGVVLRTFYHQVPRAGRDTAEITWLWGAVPQEEFTLYLRFSVDTGSFVTSAEGDAQLWIEAKGISGVNISAPHIQVDDLVDQTIWDWPFDSVSFNVGSSEIFGVGDNVDNSPLDITDDLPLLEFGLLAAPAASGDDGYIDSTGGFNNSNTTTLVGNISGTSYDAFYRFPMAVDLAGKTITEAKLLLTPGSAQAASITEIAAISGIGPTAPTSNADYLSRTLTTETREWSQGATVNGTVVTSPDFAAILQELIDAYGTLTHVVLMQKNDGSATNGRIEARAKDHLTGPAALLLIRYLP